MRSTCITWNATMGCDRISPGCDNRYALTLSSAPGLKVGGYPEWTQAPCWPDCPGCGRAMEHLLSIPSREQRGVLAAMDPARGSRGRREEQHLDRRRA